MIINYLNVHSYILLFRHIVMVTECVNKYFINMYLCCNSGLIRVFL